MYKKIVSFSFLALLVCGSLYGDATQVIMTGTADSTLMGYTAGESYTFSFVFNENYTQNSSDVFNSEQNGWYEYAISDSDVFSSISGDGLTGTYTGFNSGPYVAADVFQGVGVQYFSLGLIDSAPIGLSANGGDVYQLYNGTSVDIGEIFSFPASYENPSDYWGALAGTYTPTVGDIRIRDANSVEQTFTLTKVEIVAVPEPASVMMLLFGSGVGLFVHRLRYLAQRR